MSAPAQNRRDARRHASPFVILGAAFFVLFSVIPFLWILSTSIKLPPEIFTSPARWIPSKPTLNNYFTVVRDQRMFHYLVNSVIIASLSTSFALAAGITAGYALSRFQIPFRRTIYLTVLFGRMLPTASLVVPFFIILARLRLMNTYPSLSFVYLVTTLPLSVWLLKGFFDSVPQEVCDSALVDGCGRFGVLARVVAPMSRPAIFAVGMYAFIQAWNEFVLALVLTTDSAVRPLSVGLALYLGEYYVDWGGLMAASALMTAPPIIVFLLFQRQLIAGLAEGAVKG